MKKALFVIDTLEVGGAEKSLLDNLTHFKILKPIVCHIYEGETLKPKFLANGLNVYSLGVKKKYGFLQGFRKLKRVVADENPDIVVAYLTRSELLARIVSIRSSKPVIGTFVSDLYSNVYNQQLSFASKLVMRFFKTLNSISAKWCVGFIANSEAIKLANATQLGIPLHKIEVINRGRDSKKFSNTSRIQHSFDSIRFLNVGRLVPVKGQLMLIKAFGRFLKQYPHAVLHIVGEGPERSNLTSLIKDLALENKVSLMGSRGDLPTLMQHYDCFVFPSLSEGFSGAVVEAMMAGLPIIASDIPANAEVINHIENGYLFQANSEESIVNAMRWFQENRRIAIAMGLRAKSYSIEHFELATIASKLEDYIMSKINAS